MKRFVSILSLLVIFVSAMTVSVSADNIPLRTTVYVAGNDDFYPVEYYDSSDQNYHGVMPHILDILSQKTGIVFEYVHEKDMTQSELAEADKVHMVSAYVLGSSALYMVDRAGVFSYQYAGKNVNVGFAFTDIADPAVTERIKLAISELTPTEIIGCYMEATGYGYRPDSTKSSLWLTIVCILLLVLCIMSIIRIIRINKRNRMEKLTDEQTGIGNLTYFENNFEKIVNDDTASNYYIAYIHIDSNFLQVHRGNAVFSDTVKHAAKFIKESVKENEFLARITESGIAIAYMSPSDEEALKRAESNIKILNEREKNILNSSTYCFYCTIYHILESDYSSELILFNLRRNCHKIAGTQTQLLMCNPDMMNSALEEKKLTERLEKALDAKEFKLYLQFVANARDGRFVSAEALSRWHDPERGILSPMFYVSAMERIGIISNLDYYMFESVCRLLHKWTDTEFGHMTVSCNFTRITISEPDFPSKIRAISDRYIFDKSKLILEITEDSIEDDRDIALSNVCECRKMGFLFALDDLGSGYTSLSNLCDYPVDIVKIDRDLTLKFDKPGGKELLAGIVTLGHSLNKIVVCEGVETQEQRDFIAATDCDMIQGWYYSKVYPEKEAENYFRSYSQKN